MGEIIEIGARKGGPRTDLGKRRSSLNALKSGVHAKATIIRGVESEEEFHALMRDVLAFHSVEDPVLQLIAERLVAIAWRLRRVRRVEAEKLSLQAQSYLRASEQLNGLRAELESLTAWRTAAITVYGSAASIPAETVSSFIEGVEYLFGTSDLKGIKQPVEFYSDGLGRIEDRGKPVRRKSAMVALEAARKTLPEALARETLSEFLWSVVNALDKRSADQRNRIETQERATLESFVGALELDWQSERTISDAERRLDSAFARCLAQFFEAKRAGLSEHHALPRKAGSGA